MDFVGVILVVGGILSLGQNPIGGILFIIIGSLICNRKKKSTYSSGGSNSSGRNSSSYSGSSGSSRRTSIPSTGNGCCPNAKWITAGPPHEKRRLKCSNCYTLKP